MPTTTEDLIFNDCFEAALRIAVNAKYQGDITPIAEAMHQAAIDKLAELTDRNANQAELFVERTVMGQWLAQTEDGTASLGKTPYEAIQNLREKMA